MFISRIWFAALIVALPHAAFAQEPHPTRTLVRAGRLLNVVTGAQLANQTVIVIGNRIAAVAPTASIAAAVGDREIDLTGYTILPGLIDAHTHLTITNNFDPYYKLSLTPAKEAIIGVQSAKVTLEAGFTTVRNLGANAYTDAALRDEINLDHIPGPRMQISGPPLGITGGHCDDNLLPFQYHVTAEGVADGVSAVQQKVRQTIKYGADVIKVCATGGVLSKGDDPQASQYSLEELQAIVADAHRLGRRVAAHAHGAQGILFATQAGVDSVEHASYIDDNAIARMKQKGTYLVPTAYAGGWMEEFGNLPVQYRQKLHDIRSVKMANIKRAMAAGVKVALGTDAGVFPHGLNAHELEVYVHQLGMTPLAAVQTATVHAADLIGWAADVGTIAPGKWADMIAIEGDPLQDIRRLQHVVFVMKSGAVYKDESE